VCVRERAKTLCVCLCEGGGLEGSVRCPGIHFMCFFVYVRVCVCANTLRVCMCMYVYVCVCMWMYVCRLQ
jgi:hypothetical protein